MAQPTGWFSIRQVSERVGVSAQLIRKWEQRYRAIHPRRLTNGYRVYSERDVQTLLEVKTLLARGYSVQNAMLTVMQASRRRYEQSAEDVIALPDAPTEPENRPSVVHETTVANLIRAAERCDEQALQVYLQTAYHTHGMHVFHRSVLEPFLIAIGAAWARGAMQEYQEHLASQVVLQFLSKTATLLQATDDAPLLLCACLPHERHEIPLYMLMLEASLQGFKTAYLGASPAPRAMAEAVRRMKPQAVALSVTTDAPLQADPSILTQVEALAAEYPAIPFLLGGAVARHPVSAQDFRFLHVVSNLDQAQQLLAEVANG